MKKEKFSEMIKMTDDCSTCHYENSEVSQNNVVDCHVANAPTVNGTLPRAARLSPRLRLIFRSDRKLAFTLAETLITLTILGVIAAITVPMLINKQMEAANRTKVKKAMSEYEKVINNILIENDLRTEESFKSWAKTDSATNNYKEQRGYFKIVEDSTSNPNCRFKAGDRIWWDICGTDVSNIENPIIILDEKYKDETRVDLETLAKTEKVDGKRVYVYALVGRRDETTGSIRVNDKAYENIQENNIAYQQEIEKLYAFLDKREMSVTGETNKGICNGDDSCNKDGVTYKKMSFSNEPKTINLSGNDTSTSVATGDKYVAVIESANGKDWEYAQTACQSGTHLAKAAEIEQMWNEGASGNLLEQSCSSCSGENSPRFWVAETNSSNTSRAYAFAILRGNGMILSGLKTNTNSVNHVVCVED